MLELRPNCEVCDKDLPADATDACICSYECTYCRDCVDKLMINVCPNCGGGLYPRPIRPATEHRPGLSIVHQPPSEKRVHSRHSETDIKEFAAKLKDIPSESR